MQVGGGEEKGEAAYLSKRWRNGLCVQKSSTTHLLNCRFIKAHFESNGNGATGRYSIDSRPPSLNGSSLPFFFFYWAKAMQHLLWAASAEIVAIA
jgi:hypothetical protein